MDYYIGVDLGGTNTKIGIVTPEGTIVHSSATSTSSDAATISLNIAEGIVQLVSQNGIAWEDVHGIGIGCPGPIVSSDGVVNLTNVKMSNFNLAGAISANLRRLKIGKHLSIKLINDAYAATVAEHRFGAGRGISNLVMLTLGTGVGGGIIINDNLYRGKGAAGEFGHMIICAGGRKCSCGSLGCLETYASVSALVANAKTMRSRFKDSVLCRHKTIDGKIIFDSYVQGDTAAIKAVKEFVYYLSMGITNIINAFRPDAIIIGGGVSAVGDLLIDLIRDEYERQGSVVSGYNPPQIMHASLFNDAGMIGAALHAIDELSKPPII